MKLVLKKEDILKLNPKVRISILGGLNPNKEKFNNEHYQLRTYYTPSELASIITAFERIEKRINPMWNDLEKCMFVYKMLCEHSFYDECNYNGRDAARNLLGLITGKSVCSGYAIIFKEAMDRLGIKCYYQNREGHHSWNAVEIDGKMRAIELTWDTYDKESNKCGFRYFCRQDKNAFYSDPHHNIQGEKEEKPFDFEQIPVEVLQKALAKISVDKIHKEKTTFATGNETCTIAGHEVLIKDSIPFLSPGIRINTFVRSNGSSFLIIPTGNEKSGVKEYIYLVYLTDKKMVKATKIYSEMDLLTDDLEMRNNIANNLLSESRIATKINSFNGYVGYLEKGSNVRLYNAEFEKSLNIIR